MPYGALVNQAECPKSAWFRFRPAWRGLAGKARLPLSLWLGSSPCWGWCKHCSEGTNIKKWDMTQFMKPSSLSLAALCCLKPGQCREDCERPGKKYIYKKNLHLKLSHTDRRSQAQDLKTWPPWKTPMFLPCGNLFTLSWCGTSDAGCDVWATQCIGLMLCRGLGRKTTQEPRGLQSLGSLYKILHRNCNCFKGVLAQQI